MSTNNNNANTSSRPPPADGVSVAVTVTGAGTAAESATVITAGAPDNTVVEGVVADNVAVAQKSEKTDKSAMGLTKRG